MPMPVGVPLPPILAASARKKGSHEVGPLAWYFCVPAPVTWVGFADFLLLVLVAMVDLLADTYVSVNGDRRNSPHGVRPSCAAVQVQLPGVDRRHPLRV